MRRGARDHVGRARRRPRHRPAVPGQAGRVRAHRRPQGPRAPAARRAPTWRSCRRPASPSTRWARSARSSTASASTSQHKGPTNAVAMAADRGADRHARRRVRLHQPRRDRPGLRPPQRRPRLPRGAARRSTRRWETWLPRLDPERDLLIITADHGCDPTTPGTDHTREHVPLLARFDGHDGKRHDGPFADVGASVLQVAHRPGRAASGHAVRLNHQICVRRRCELPR